MSIFTYRRIMVALWIILGVVASALVFVFTTGTPQDFDGGKVYVLGHSTNAEDALKAYESCVRIFTEDNITNIRNGRDWVDGCRAGAKERGIDCIDLNMKDPFTENADATLKYESKVVIPCPEGNR